MGAVRKRQHKTGESYWIDENKGWYSLFIERPTPDGLIDRTAQWTTPKQSLQDATDAADELAQQAHDCKAKGCPDWFDLGKP